ncbi:hypothetical protein VNO80_28090 [Phaseolus coccineus]|uniref:Uncharacterized protein n=1 Tax=Phaseolus coccineus TaxID=3886 RepID=A0AAN9QLQ3_PHACN
MKTFVKMHFTKENVFEIGNQKQRRWCGAATGFEREEKAYEFAARRSVIGGIYVLSQHQNQNQHQHPLLAVNSYTLPFSQNQWLHPTISSASRYRFRKHHSSSSEPFSNLFFTFPQLRIFGSSGLIMLDALFMPKFYSKSKSRLKLINRRLETIGKKRKAVQKFLKKDIVDLLGYALDYNAYGRAEGLLVDQNMLLCYELVGKFANCVLSHVRDLCKQRDCPDECKEAIQSLIYAAARFSDLPELRDLRTLFTPKFGNTLEPYICKEFVDKLRQVPPSKEMKIQLLRDLSQEFSIEWDSKALEQRLHSPPLLLEDKTKYDPLNDRDDHMNNDVAVAKIDNLVTGGKQRHERNWHTSNGNERDTLTQGKKDMSDAYWRVQSSTDNETTSDNSSLEGRNACSSSLGSVSVNETEIKHPSSFSYKLVPPPYVNEKLNKPTESEPLPKKESNHDDLYKPVVPKGQIPRSVRRRPLKPPLYDNTVSNSKTGGSEKVEYSSGKESEKVNGDSKDYEENIMEGLLMHYSKKQYPYESGIGKAACPKVYPMQRVEDDKGHRKQKSSIHLVRGISLPSDDPNSMETFKVNGRATSLEPQMLRTAGHVHPSLPDYDDLSARLAALRNPTQPA